MVASTRQTFKPFIGNVRDTCMHESALAESPSAASARHKLEGHVGGVVANKEEGAAQLLGGHLHGTHAAREDGQQRHDLSGGQLAAGARAGAQAEAHVAGGSVWHAARVVVGQPLLGLKVCAAVARAADRLQHPKPLETGAMSVVLTYSKIDWHFVSELTQTQLL